MKRNFQLQKFALKGIEEENTLSTPDYVYKAIQRN